MVPYCNGRLRDVQCKDRHCNMLLHWLVFFASCQLQPTGFTRLHQIYRAYAGVHRKFGDFSHPSTYEVSVSAD